MGVICTRIGFQGLRGCLDHAGSLPQSLRKLIFAREFDPHPLGVTFCAPEKSGSQPELALGPWIPRVPWIILDQAETC